MCVQNVHVRTNESHDRILVECILQRCAQLIAVCVCVRACMERVWMHIHNSGCVWPWRRQNKRKTRRQTINWNRKEDINDSKSMRMTFIMNINHIKKNSVSGLFPRFIQRNVQQPKIETCPQLIHSTKNQTKVHFRFWGDKCNGTM